VLQALAYPGVHVSGEEISSSLGVSRTAVWKAISALRHEGLVIDAIPNKGYLIRSPVDILDLATISQAAPHLVRKVIHLEEVDSTNDYLKKLAQAGEPEGLLLVAETQSAGRGRLGRQWQSTRRQGLWFSLLLRPQVTPAQAVLLTMVAGLAVTEALRELCKADIRVKWPNDVLAQQGKICGILTEMSGEMECVAHIVLGIGINVHQAATGFDHLPAAASVSMIRQQPISRTEVFTAVLRQLEVRYNQWMEGEWPYLRESWLQVAAYLRQEVALNFPGGKTIRGTFVGVSDAGGIIVQAADGSRQTLYSGEVSLRPGI